MIPCQHCGHPNPIGTMYCHSCGQKVEVKASQIMGAVAQHQADSKHDKQFTTGKSILVMGGFCLIMTLVLRSALAPSLPPANLPNPPALPANTVLNPNPTWPEHVLAEQAGAAQTVDRYLQAAGPGLETSLLAWRTAHITAQLGIFSVDLGRIRAWQEEVLSKQLENGAFPGGDRTAATALSCLALQAYPGDKTIDAAAAKARTHLRKQLTRLQRGEGSDLATALTVWALYAEDGAEALRGLSARLANGKEPMWQLLMWLHCQPDHIPEERSALAAAANKNPLTATLLRILDSSADATDFATLNNPVLVEELETTDKIAWALASWLTVSDIRQLRERLKEWTKHESPLPSPPDFSLQTGAQTDFALAVLSSTVTAAMPANRSP